MDARFGAAPDFSTGGVTTGGVAAGAGVGAGVVAIDAKEVSETMFLEASEILAKLSPQIKDPSASLLPDIVHVRSVCRAIAIGVAKKAIEEGLSKVAIKDVERRVDEIMWTPSYAK
jgi:malate dehydrogenase (oxaloacetate-decarboxylating)